MDNNLLDQLEQLDQPWFYKLTLIGGTILFLFSGWLWWSKVSVQTDRVFWGAISNNLVISGVTRQANSKDEAGSLEQYQQITLGAQNVVKTAATVEQTSQAGKTRVLTETVATPQADFSRYVSIETGQKNKDNQPFDFSAITNQWGQQAVEAETSGSFSEALFGDLVPFANLQASKRNPIVNNMKNNNVYTIDKVDKRREGGRLIYDYTIKVSPEQYLKALKQIDEAMGLKQLSAIDESQYAGAQPIQVKLSIDAHAQQVVGIAYEGDARSVKFMSYGAQPRVDVPVATIPQADLQTKLNNILGTQ